MHQPVEKVEAPIFCQAERSFRLAAIQIHLKKLWDSVRIYAFVVGTALTIFVAARNTVTWHVQHLWGASGSYWQWHWENIVDLCGGDEFTLAVWGTVVLGIFSFWLYNLIFLILDTTGHPQVLLKYKVQPDKNVPVAWPNLKKAAFLVLFNQTVIGIPVIYFWYRAMKWRGCSFGRDLPSFQWVLVELVSFTLVEEVMFYYSHRLLHHPRLYKHIHKIHHEWTAPIGIVAIYAHPLEHIVSNLLPPITGPVLMGSHLATAWLWIALVLASTTVAHCGYHLPFLPSPEAHDFHHLKFINNFGVLGVLDRLHGTDTLFRTSKAYQRHFMLLGICPTSQQIPDDTKKQKD